MEASNLETRGERGVRRLRWLTAALAIAAAGLFAPQGTAQSADGKAVYKDANCIGCHKWHGQGGGGYGGAALSLREMMLEREQLVEVIVCGRMGTRMPYHLRAAWKASDPCYGMTADEIGEDVPPRPASFLRSHQIEAVTDYVIENLQGRGDPTKEECLAFWGAESRECARF